MKRAILTGLLGLCVLTVHVSTAAAAAPQPAWSLRSISRPTDLAPGTEFGSSPLGYKGNESDYIQIFATNDGAAAISGTFTIKDSLPSGLTLASAGARIYSPGSQFLSEFQVGSCQPTGNGVECEVEEFSLLPDRSVFVIVPVAVALNAPELVENVVTAEGGGATAASISEPVHLTSQEASFGLQDAAVTATEEAGGAEIRAGANPYELSTTFDFNTRLSASGHLIPPADPKNVEVALPPGLIGNPTAATECRTSEFVREQSECPKSSQIGVATIIASPIGINQPSTEEAGIFNLVPRPGAPAEFGFNVSKEIILLTPHLRGGDYGLTTISKDTPQTIRIFGVSAVIWGRPDSASHDDARGNCYQTGEDNCTVEPGGGPFLRMPTSCAGPLSATLSIDSWQDPADVVSKESTLGPGLNGCEQLAFDPHTTVVPEAHTSETATGLTADVTAEQEGLLTGESEATADLKNTKVSLPTGVVINPGDAAGLEACLPGQAAVGTEEEAHCPPASQVGTAEVLSPLLRDPLKGSVYVLQSNPPEVKLLVAVAADGVDAKLVGVVHLDPVTGRLVTTFDESPQLPFTDFKLSFAGGVHSAIITPQTCGTYTTEADFTPWSTPWIADVLGTSPFVIDAGPNGSGAAGCKAPLPFSPSLEAGTTQTLAGHYSPFSLRVTRQDGEQNISRIAATLPDGLLAKLSGVPLCPDAQAATAACPPSSQVGATTTGIGAGTQLLYVPQPGKAPTAVYLAGPYKGAPYSLVIGVPAQAGPFDLGTIAVRAALNVDPITAQVTATSDPLPQILQGVPIEYRDIRVNVTRPEFTLDPTSCEPMKVTSTVTSVTGATSNPSSRFQVAGCEALAFKPTIALSLKGGTKRHSFPALKATVTYPKHGSYANIKKAQITLPHSEFLEQGHIGTVCTRVQFAAKACPKASIYGKAMAISPLLDKPVSGPVYLRSSSNPLPDLVAELNGQIDVVLDGRVDTGKGGGIRNTFQAVPDAPVSKFTLELKGGKKGLLVNSENICSKPQHATADFTGQNGKIYNTDPLIANSCSKKSKGKKK